MTLTFCLGGKEKEEGEAAQWDTNFIGLHADSRYIKFIYIMCVSSRDGVLLNGVESHEYKLIASNGRRRIWDLWSRRYLLET